MEISITFAFTFNTGKLCRIPHGATDIDIGVTSPPTQWPGVKFFLSILSVNKKDDRNVLNLLLCEAAVAVYLSIFVSACSRLSCNNFYRYVLNGLTEDMWNNVFGGGTKIVIPAPNSQPKKNSSPLGQPKDASRSKYVYKMLGNKVQENSGPDPGAQVSYNDNQKMFRHELFIPPNLSLCDYFLKKVSQRTRSLNCLIQLLQQSQNSIIDRFKIITYVYVIVLFNVNLVFCMFRICLVF